MGDSGESREKVRFDSHFLADVDAVEIINSIDGNQLEYQLIELAGIGGEELSSARGHRKRYATNRVALSPEDAQATEEFIVPLMEKAGAVIYRHPLAVIGTYEGENPDLPPIVIMSHTDTVPKGDMYDGTTGVLAGIATLQAMKEAGFLPKRNIMIASLTGEESARFNIALFGSRALWHGLRSNELALTDEQGSSIAELLGKENAEIVRKPIFGPNGDELPAPAAVIELHVEQGKMLEEKTKDGKSYKADIGVVEAIAAPARFHVTIGEKNLAPDDTHYTHSTYIKLSLAGKAGHTGSTPMGVDNRADGLVETAGYLQEALNEHGDMSDLLSISHIEIDEQGMNKIPGVTEAVLRVAGDDQEKVTDAVRFLEYLVDHRNGIINGRHPKFDQNPVRLTKIKRPEDIVFFEPKEMLERQKKAFSLIRVVNNSAQIYGDKEVVGTVSTYTTTPNGQIILGLDLRGMTQDGRQEMIDTINRSANAIGTPLGEPLPGSGEPTESDASLVAKAMDVMKQFETGEPLIMKSKAGHDIQNAARAGVPTVLLFCRSEDGIAHNPDGYTRPEDLERGARSLAALVLKLASQ